MTVPHEDERKHMLDERFRNGLITMLLKDRQLESTVPATVAEGDVVVVYADKGSAADSCREAGLVPNWMASAWTMPMKVTGVTKTQVTMQRYGERGKFLTVHRDKVRKFVISKDPLLSSITKQYANQQSIIGKDTSLKRQRIEEDTLTLAEKDEAIKAVDDLFKPSTEGVEEGS